MSANSVQQDDIRIKAVNIGKLLLS